MNKKELRKKLFELSPNELAYKASPDKTVEFYNELENISEDPDHPIFVLDFNSITSKNRAFVDSGEKSEIFFTNSNIVIGLHTKYSKPPMHIHNYIEMNYVYSGKCTQIMNGKTVQLKEGDVCILDTNVPHTILDTEENDVVINIMFSKSYFSAAFLSRLAENGIMSEFLVKAISHTQHDNNFILFHCARSLVFKELMENVLCEYFSKKICTKEIIDSYMVIIFGEMLRSFQREQSHRQSSTPYLGDILEYIEKNYQKCTLASTATHFNFHPNYLSSLIKKKTGKTYKELIQSQRMKKAAVLLENSNLNINDIAIEVGYNNLGFFYKKFQSYYEMTPYEYRGRN
ncbi:AraC family transcriptional regulator [Bacillus solitudinis]|uniref:AraC family transcriptional regulator n=1 Tax=Bacillus solitudinis TaxID=2014074 RepID=UPI000C23863E|nr:AraC family transcriptional regulator [Bacillus solitudinis]